MPFSPDVLKLNPHLRKRSRLAVKGESGSRSCGRSKYGARRTELDGIWFDSAGEAKRYSDLRLRAQAGDITDLKHHVKFALVVNGFKVGIYEADFTYCDAQGNYIVEDFKSAPTRTPVYRLKKALMRALYDITIYETSKENS